MHPKIYKSWWIVLVQDRRSCHQHRSRICTIFACEPDINSPLFWQGLSHTAGCRRTLNVKRIHPSMLIQGIVSPWIHSAFAAVQKPLMYCVPSLGLCSSTKVFNGLSGIQSNWATYVYGTSKSEKGGWLRMSIRTYQRIASIRTSHCRSSSQVWCQSCPVQG